MEGEEDKLKEEGKEGEWYTLRGREVQRERERQRGKKGWAGECDTEKGEEKRETAT